MSTGILRKSNTDQSACYLRLDLCYPLSCSCSCSLWSALEAGKNRIAALVRVWSGSTKGTAAERGGGEEGDPGSGLTMPITPAF